MLKKNSYWCIMLNYREKNMKTTPKTGVKSALFLLIPLIFSACFSSWQGDEAQLTLQLGSAGRAVDTGILGVLEHRITLTGGSGTMPPIIVSRGKTSVTATVVPGAWDISVKAFLDEKPFAEGSAKVILKAGKNNAVTIAMKVLEDDTPIKPEPPVGVEINITGWEDQGKLVFNQDADITIYQNGEPGSFKTSVALNNNDLQYDLQIEAYVFGNQLAADNDGSITINAADYAPGTYTLTLITWIDDILYSGEIRFTVSGNGVKQ